MNDTFTPKFNFDYLQKLAELMDASGLEEVEMQEGDSTVRLRKPKATVNEQHFVQAAPAAVAAPAPATPAVQEPENSFDFKAPMVGTFYAAPSPDADNFINVGDRVKKGQVICIIEAMKTFNQIEAEEDGILKAILPDNAQPVEYGESLFRFEKA